jgi:hypothetical protein
LIERLLGIFVITGTLALLAGFLTTALLLTGSLTTALLLAGFLTRRLVPPAGLVLVRHAVSFHENANPTVRSSRSFR